jgi:hypothetical protein
MDRKRETDELAAFAGRTAGTDVERRAAVHLRERLRQMGRKAELEAIEVRPRIGLVHTFHALLAIVGSVVVVSSPLAGSVLVFVAGVLALLDLTGILPVTRRLTGRRASQDVFSREDGGRAATLILVAHYDVGRNAPAFRLARRVLRSPWLVLLGAIGALLVCCGLRALGLEGNVLTAVQFVPTVLLILLVPALADLELSDADDGAADNAAGVVTVLGLAEDIGGALRSFDVWVLLTGSQKPFAVGMRAWLRRHRGELDRERTAVINVDGVGSGPVRFARREGPLLARRAHPQLLRICEEIAEDDGNGGAYEARPVVIRERTDASAARSKKLPAITLSCDGHEVTAEGLERMRAFCRELIERLDAEVAPTLAAPERDREAEAAGT